MNMTDIGWLAGFIDGEGSVCLDRRGVWRQPLLSATSTDIELLENVRRLVGGCITPVKVRRPRKASWLWKLNGAQQVIVVLRTVVDYMHCPQKIRRAQHIIREYTAVTSRNGFYTDDLRAAKIEFEQTFFRL